MDSSGNADTFCGAYGWEHQKFQISGAIAMLFPGFGKVSESMGYKHHIPIVTPHGCSGCVASCIAPRDASTVAKWLCQVRRACCEMRSAVPWRPRHAPLLGNKHNWLFSWLASWWLSWWIHDDYHDQIYDFLIYGDCGNSQCFQRWLASPCASGESKCRMCELIWHHIIAGTMYWNWSAKRMRGIARNWEAL